MPLPRPTVHPDKTLTIAVMLNVAEKAAVESNSVHPEDIAAAISMAVESAGVTINEARKVGLIA